jgi:integrase
MRRTQPQGLHRLSAAAIRYLETPGWHADGGGLYLEIDTNGRKRWAMRLTVNGKRRDFGLGPLHKVSLAEARETAADYRTKAYRGIDPVAEKRKHVATPSSVPTFREAANAVHRQRAQGWSNGKHVDQWINTLRDYAFPIIGDMAVSDIATPDVLKVLTPIWSAKLETARRVRQRLSTVLEWARAAGFRSGDNPVDLIGDALPRQRKTERHHAALPYTDVAAFIAKLRDGQAASITKLAFEFLILTAARTTEARKARWDEVDLKAKTWTIPGNDETTGRRMKKERDHVVPLSTRCLVILAHAKGLSKDHDLIFPDGSTGRVMSENRFLVARDGLGYGKDGCTPHGFRSSFRDWAAEETNFPSEVVEMALAHAIPNKTEAAYRRGQLLAKRFELMESWAAFACPASAVDSALAG